MLCKRSLYTLCAHNYALSIDFGKIPQPMLVLEHALADHCQTSQGTQVILLSDDGPHG